MVILPAIDIKDGKCEMCIRDRYNAVVRADNAPIVIGARSNIQDCCVLHVDEGHPIQIGDGVTVGHGAISVSYTHLIWRLLELEDFW